MSDRGAGSITVVAIVATIFAITAMIIPLGAALTVRQQAAGAADAAALAAADVAVGLRAGSPCSAASSTAAANGAVVSACVVDGAVVTVSVQIRSGVLPVTAAATAGPPDAR